MAFPVAGMIAMQTAVRSAQMVQQAGDDSRRRRDRQRQMAEVEADTKPATTATDASVGTDDELSYE